MLNTNEVNQEINPFEENENDSNKVINLKKQLINDMKKHVCHNLIKNIPHEMKECNNWIYSNESKAPINSKGYNVNGLDIKNCTSFDNIVNNNNNMYYYTFSLNNNFFVIDLDECIDNNGKLYDFALDVLNEVKDYDCYIEYSVSKKGLHIIFKNSKKWNNLKTIGIKMKNIHSKYETLPHKSGIDILNNNHLIILTGDIYEHKKPSNLGILNNKIMKIYKRFEGLINIRKTKIKSNMDKKTRNKSLDENDIFDFIKTQVSIEDICNHYNIPYNTFTNINCPLPKHEDNTPSFRIYTSTNSFNCFGCGNGGSILDLVSQMENYSIIESAKKISELFDLDIDFDNYEKDLINDWVIFNNGKYDIDTTILRNHLINDHNVLNTNHDLYIYSDNYGYYKIIKPFEIKKFIEDHLPSVYNNKYKSTYYVDEIYNQTKRNFIDFKEFNVNRDIISFNNTILKFTLNTDKIDEIDNSPDYMNTFHIPFDYIKNKKCEKWTNFLNDSLPKEQQKILQEIFGYCMINNNRAKKFFSLYGKGDTGKSVVLETLKRCIGSEQTSAMSLQDLTNKNSKFNTSSLLNKLVNICGDLPSLPIEDSSTVKQLTGDDEMRFEKKGQQPIFSRNTARLVFSMNKIPSSRDKSQEFFNRMLIIPFTNICPKDKIDKNLVDKFNLIGVISWSIDGLQRLMKNNLNFSETTENINLVDHYSTIDSPVIEFVKDVCIITDNKNDEITQKDLMKYYKFYCTEILNNEYAAKIKINNLIEEIVNKFVTIEFSKNVTNPITGKKSARGFKNIILKQDFVDEYNNVNNINMFETS